MLSFSSIFIFDQVSGSATVARNCSRTFMQIYVVVIQQRNSFHSTRAEKVLICPIECEMTYDLDSMLGAHVSRTFRVWCGVVRAWSRQLERLLLYIEGHLTLRMPENHLHSTAIPLLFIGQKPCLNPAPGYRNSRRARST